MKKFARPAFITILAATIVLGIAVFASSHVSQRGVEAYQTPLFVHVQKTVPQVDDIALKGTSGYRGVPARALVASAPMPGSARQSSTTTQIARTGMVSLLVSSVDKAVSAVTTLTQQQSGDVLSLDDKGRTENGGQSSADMQVRVPEDRFERTMQALGQIGSARSRSINAEDLTTQIVDSTARLRNLRRTELDIQKIMDRSGSVGQILEAENQLSTVREQIETLDADVKSMQSRVRYSTISVTLLAEASTAPSEPTAAAQLVSAWRAARHSVAQFTIGIAAMVVWIAAFVPYLLLAALCFWLVRRRLVRLAP
jgi:type III secretory pathway lipoprotein EscJ